MPTRVDTIGKTRVGGKLTSRCFPIGLAHAQYSFTKKTRDKSIQKGCFCFFVQPDPNYARSYVGTMRLKTPFKSPNYIGKINCLNKTAY